MATEVHKALTSVVDMRCLWELEVTAVLGITRMAMAMEEVDGLAEEMVEVEEAGEADMVVAVAERV